MTATRVVLAWTLLVLAAGARAEKSAEQPFRGVTLLRFERTDPRPLRAWAAVIDLTVPGVVVEASPGDGQGPGRFRAAPLPALARRHGYDVCVNASVFRPHPALPGQPVTVDGPAVHGGVEIAPARTRRHALCILPDGRAAVLESPLPDVREAVAGFDLPPCLVAGKVHGPPGAPQPRTAAGVSEDGRRLILLVVDGRQPGVSEGVSLHEVGAWLRELGAHDGINLDGGGSSTFVVRGERGEPEIRNTPVGLGVPGTVRTIGNALGVRAPRREATTGSAPALDGGKAGLATVLAVVAAVAVLGLLVLLSRSRANR
jgi:hypothetical protein